MSASGQRESQSFFLPAIVFAAVFLGLLPFVFAFPWWKDSGELVTAFAGGAIAHPGGFAANAVLAKLFALLPLGSHWFGVALFSVFCAAAVCAGLALLLLRSLPEAPRWLLLPAVLSLVASFLLCRTVWIHSVSVEVYLPAAAVVMLALQNALAGRGRSAGSGQLLWGAFLTGLALAFHISAAIGAGLCLVYIVLLHCRPSSPKRLRIGSLAGPVLCFAAGLVPLLYLPMISAREQAFSFAQISSLRQLLDHVSGASIRNAFSAQMLPVGAGEIFANLSTYLGALAAETPLALLLALLAFASRAVRHRHGGLLCCLGLVWAADAAFSFLVNPMGQVDWQTGVISRLCVTFLAVLLPATLLSNLESWRALARPTGLAMAGLLLLLPVGPMLSMESFERSPGLLADLPGDAASLGADCAGQHGPEIYSRALFSGLAPESLALTGLDDASSLAMYGRLLENRRPDSVFLVKQALGFPGIHGRLAAMYAGHFPVAKAEQLRTVPAELRGRLRDFVTNATARKLPLAWQFGQSELDAAAGAGFEQGLVLSKRRAGALCVQPALAAEAFEACRLDRMGAGVVSGGLSSMASRVMSTCGPEHRGQAVKALLLALRHWPGNCRAWNNLAVAQGLEGTFAEAALAAGRAAELCPANPSGRKNEVYFLFLSGKSKEARAKALALLEDFPAPVGAAMLQSLSQKLSGEDRRHLEGLINRR